MKHPKLIATMALLTIMLTAASCEAIGGIFKAGMGVGILIVVVVIAVIVALILRAGK